jgi:hypothetical protein
MLNLLRLVFAIFLIILIAPQTLKENIILKTFHSQRIIVSYAEEKRLLKNITWFSIIGFLAVAFFTCVK